MIMYSNDFDVVGYSYNAEIICSECAYELGKRQALAAGSSYSWGDGGTAEDALNGWANVIGLDRVDESSFDSDDFPKVILRNQAHVGCREDNGYAPAQCSDRCGWCHEHIDGDCPNGEG